MRTEHRFPLEVNKPLASTVWARRVLICIVLIVPVILGLLQLEAPKPVSSNAAAEVFSSERAIEKLRVIAKEPHPLGSLAHDEVRDYLLSELQNLGLEPEIQQVRMDVGNGQSGSIENIMARIPGTDNSRAVMIAAHYDSVRSSPGAADDGAGIAAILETIRALQALGPLNNDTIILMTDGEELGLLGAKAFVTEHPWAKDVGVVLNFEARGNQGPSLMFETSEQNGWLIKQFVEASPHPLAYSIIYDLYKIMPNDTDMTMFRMGGMAGLNFAFGMGVNAYHDPIDTVDNLDPSSLQHHGDYMLSLTRQFGQLDLNKVEQGNQVYFNLIGSNLVIYPQSWVFGLLLAGILLYAAAIIHAIVRKGVTIKGMLGGFFLCLLSLIIVYGVITLLWTLLRHMVSHSQLNDMVLDPKISLAVLMGLLLVTLVVIVIIIRWTARIIRMDNMWAGTLLLWVLLSISTALYLPGGSYLFLWPLIGSIIGFHLFIRNRTKQGAMQWSASLSAMPGLLLFAPICYLIYILMTLGMAAALCTIAALALSLIYPVIGSASRQDTRHVNSSD